MLKLERRFAKQVYFGIIKPFLKKHDIAFLSDEYRTRPPDVFVYCHISSTRYNEMISLIFEDNLEAYIPTTSLE